MQSAEGEGVEAGWEEGRSSQDEKGTKKKEGLDKAEEDWGETVLPEDHTGPEPDDSAPQPQADLSGVDEEFPVASNSVQDDVSYEPVTLHFSNLNTSEDMEDQDEEEEEEFIVLDPEHPLVRRQQAALNSQLSKQLERINLELKEKLVMEKADASYIQEISVEMFNIQEQVARLHSRLDDRHQTKAQAEAKQRQAQDQLEAMKSHYSSTTSQYSKAKTNVSQLQAETDNLMQHLVFTQGISEELHSNVKVMKNARRKAGAEKDQAEEQKLKQDLYVERLTKDMERLMQQIAMYEAQASAQTEETQTAKEALSEAEMEMESLVVARKQLLQQWNSSLVGMKSRDEAFNAMQEALREVEHQVILLDREIEGYKKSTTEEQEQNETLTLQLNWSQLDGATSKKLISQKQAQQEALQAHYSTCLRTLRETERTLARLTKEASTHQAEVNDQRRQLEKESAVRLELEDKIMTQMQQRLTHNKAAKYSQRLTSKIATLKKDKISQLWQLENAVMAVGLECSEVSQHLDSLALTQEALDDEIAKCNKLLTSNQAKISSLVILIGQRQSTIANYNKQICQIAASTGREDLSPLQIKVEALIAQIEELSANIKSDQQLWIKQQGTLVGLTQEIEANSKNMFKLQAEYTGMQQKKIRLERQIEAEHRDQTELEKDVKMLRGDLLKLNSLLSKNGQISQALEQENALLETDFLHRFKEAERESVGMQMKHEKTQEEKERLLNSLVEAERQIMLWEKKTQLIKETRSAVDSEVGQGEIQMIKAEIHRMEVRLSQLMKQQERLLRESEATVARRETIVLRREAMVHSSHKQTTKGELTRFIQGLQRRIQDTHKHVTECEQVIRELQESQVSLNDKLAQQKQQLIELCGTSCILDPDFVNLQDTKDRNLAHLVALQSRTKKLQGVCEGSYQALSTSESIGTALQSQMERVHATSTILHRVCEEFPQHQEAFRRLSLALAARTHALDQEAS
ncbi:coiled-coil domain-containing protein 40 [Toxotes jaculatrix]|uniref:coiled-coil domain-containing protein 40 n=1 Tax=Toxotes jaculatrix TaxID=941984 RepID=UPI001B3ADD5E|nr:coiled-coil domain-containing protein 40 [Toxotes jaculatrix]